MYNPISCEFFDQLTVAIQRKIPSTIIYFENEQQITIKGLVKELIVINGIEYLVLTSDEKVNLHSVFSFNGKKHKVD